ncbi:MAG: AMP-binding protein [Actinomycetota bacterium]|nr:AMP-binding protein [Actinomycetota bacterium]MDD5667607.1 AMP-binding protein [Actinomycetota bacterium]
MTDIYAQKPWLKYYDDHVTEFLDYEDKPYNEKFVEAAARVPDNRALIYMDNVLTFRDVDNLSNQMAAYFLKLGLKPDDVIGLHALNIPANYICMVAAQKAGCVTTGISPLLTPHELEHQLNDSGAKVVLTMDMLFPLIAGVADKCGFSTVIVAGTTDFMPGEFPPVQVQDIPGKTVVSFADAIEGMPEDLVLVPRTMDDTIFIMYTGGTTGPSKGAVLTQRNFMAMCLMTLTWADVPGYNGEVGISAFPMFHMAGLAMAAGLLQGGMGQICVPNPRDLDFIIGAIEKHKPNSIINVPTIFFELLKKPEFRALDFSGIEYCISGAAPFPPESIPDINRVVGENKFIELYGMTETSPITICNPRYGMKKIGSVGIPYPDTEVKLTDPETDEPVPLGETGEICVRGPQVMKGYYNKQEETANAIRDGWMHTGDLGRMDEDGYFYVVDRLKDMVIVSGYKVFTRELDDELAKHPDVEMAATIGFPDPDRPGSERVMAAVILKPGIEKSEEEKEKLMQYLRDTVAPYKVPKLLNFYDTLPVSAVGKILKRELRVMIMEDKS